MIPSDNNQIVNEITLLNSIAKGDQKAFALLFRQYSKVLYPFALRLTHSTALAEEILQEVFLKVWVRREQLSTIENFGAYVNRMTRNQAYNVLSSMSRELIINQQLSRQLSEETNETQEQIEFHETQRNLDRVIEQLTPQQKQVYKLCHEEGLKYAEVARKLNISSSTVHTHMKHALHFIRTHILRIVFYFISLHWFI